MKHFQRFLRKLRMAFPGSANQQFFCAETGYVGVSDNRRTVSNYIPAHEHCTNISNCQL